MKTLVFFTFISSVLFSCKKITETVISPANVNPANNLKINRVINDSSIVLKWDSYTGKDFKSYRLLRTATYLKNGLFTMYTETVDSISDMNSTSFTETNMPLAIDINYQLTIIKNNTPAYAGMYYGNVTYKRPNSLLLGQPADVLIDKTNKKLYITEQKKITIIDYNGRVVQSKEFSPGIGYCALGSFAGNNELYVPENDGWLLILDAATLQLKDKIYIKGFNIASVLAINNKLFISTSDMTGSIGYENCLQSYDRSTKTLIAKTGYWPQTRLLQLENSSQIEMIDITLNILPVDLSFYRFNSDGTLQLKVKDNYHGDYSMNHSIVRSFPDGSRFITSGSGTVFNKSLVFEKYLKQNGSYTDFAFNNDGAVIYAASPQKIIEAINYPSLNISQTYQLKMYPYKIFRDGNTLICVTLSATGWQATGYAFVEKVNL